MNSELIVHNWRCFTVKQFELPNKSFLLVDQNGSGKTSLISAIYSLLAKKPWPQSKFADHLQQGQNYFGVSTNITDLFLTGQINRSGRFNFKHSFPEGDLNFMGKEIKKTQFPCILTYLPTDNYWLNQSRTNKINTLNIQLEQIFGKKYDQAIKDLDKSVKSKQNILKQTIDFGGKTDMVLLEIINQRILEASFQIWAYRLYFFQTLQANLQRFRELLELNLKDWQTSLHISDFQGQRVQIFPVKTNKFSDERSEFSIASRLNNFIFDPEFLSSTLQLKSTQTNYNHPVFAPELWRKLWQKELIVGKVLFGAQRDDFEIKVNDLPVQNILSRGELRFLVLFIKSLATGNLRQLQTPIWWFLDDVFNELDEKREQFLLEKILSGPDFFIATAAKSPSLDLNSFSIDQLTK